LGIRLCWNDKAAYAAACVGQVAQGLKTRAVPGQTTVEGVVVENIPVPGSALLTASGLALFGLLRRKRRSV
jgi:hypothetical protein